MGDDERDDDGLLGDSQWFPGLILVVAFLVVLILAVAFKVVNG